MSSIGMMSTERLAALTDPGLSERRAQPLEPDAVVGTLQLEEVQAGLDEPSPVRDPALLVVRVAPVVAKRASDEVGELLAALRDLSGRRSRACVPAPAWSCCGPLTCIDPKCSSWSRSSRRLPGTLEEASPVRWQVQRLRLGLIG